MSTKCGTELSLNWGKCATADKFPTEKWDQRLAGLVDHRLAGFEVDTLIVIATLQSQSHKGLFMEHDNPLCYKNEVNELL